MANLSGCELQAELNRIGLKNILMCFDKDEVLGEFDDNQLADEMTSNNERDHRALISELFMSNVILNSENEEELQNKLLQLFDEVGI